MRSSALQKYALTLLLSLLLTGSLQADPPVAGKGAEDVPPEQVQNKQKDSRVGKASKPKQTFTPSEKISADSAVSFPVDI